MHELKEVGNQLWTRILIALLLCTIQVNFTVNAVTTSTCSSLSNCTLREWLVKIQEEAYSLECTLSQLEKSTALLSKVNYPTTSTRLNQITKLKKTISNLKGEIEIINLTCSTFYGPDCNLTTPECNSKCITCSSPGVCSNCSGNWDGPTCSVCKSGWNGTDCNIPICDSKCANCTSPGVCSNCTGNWIGSNCSTCKNGWNGTLCNIPICDSKCITCTSPGQCSNCTGNWNGTTCSICKSGWNETDCNTPICGPNCVSCVSPNVCPTCKPGWTGSDCNTVSLILSSAQITKFTTLIMSNAQITSSKLLYKGLIDGFSASAFHSKCDNKGPTIVIVKATSGAIFGGYTSLSWQSTYSRLPDSSSFLFSLVSSTKEERFAKLIQQYSYYYKTYGVNNPKVIYNSEFDGPRFGSGDLTIKDNSNIATDNPANVCHSYCDSIMTYDSNAGQTYLAGSIYFQVEDYEVYSL